MGKRNTEMIEVFMHEEHTNTGKIHKAIVNKDTGEIIKDWWVEEKDTPTGRPPGKKAYFLKTYRSNWLDIAVNKRLTPYEAGIFSMISAFLDWQSPHLVHPKTGKNLNESEISQLLKIDRAQVNKTMQALCQKGFIKKISGGNGRANHFIMNTNIVFYGSTIKDINDHKTFTKDCSYDPVLKMKYQQSQQK